MRQGDCRKSGAVGGKGGRGQVVLGGAEKAATVLPKKGIRVESGKVN